MLELPYKTADFTVDAESAKFIENDKLSVKALTARSCLTTREMQHFVRTKLTKNNISSRIKVFCFLATDDKIIDNNKTKKLMDGIGAEIIEYDTSAHSLALDVPEMLAKDIARRI